MAHSNALDSHSPHFTFHGCQFHVQHKKCANEFSTRKQFIVQIFLQCKNFAHICINNLFDFFIRDILWWKRNVCACLFTLILIFFTQCDKNLWWLFYHAIDYDCCILAYLLTCYFFYFFSCVCEWAIYVVMWYSFLHYLMKIDLIK